VVLNFFKINCFEPILLYHILKQGNNYNILTKHSLIMRPTLLHLFGIILIILSPSISVFSNTITYCKYSDDPIIVENDQHRENLQLSGNENLLTFCNLKVGEVYNLSGFSPVDLSCPFTFNLFGVEVSGLGTEDSNINQGSFQLFTFEAISSCMDIVVLNNGCNTQASYPANLSIVCTSCEAKVEPSSNSLLPVMAVDPNWTVEDLISEIFIGGDCFDVSGVNEIGSASGKGLFLAGTSSIGMEKGVIMSTGFASNAPGPCGPNASSSNGGTGDADLAQLSGSNIADATGIEFDFIPTLSDLSFDFAFASEEYCEFVGAYNDAFGFFISGPGINGPFSNNAENIALIPGTNTNVAINTVNQNTNTGYFNPNANGSCGSETNCADIKYDGYTAVFTATISNLTPCETYHIKLVVGDANDQIYDSAVFLGNGSFDAGGDLDVQSVVPNGNGNTAIEACQDGQFILTRNAIDLNLPLTFSFNVGGTATPGLDYVPFPTTITFPAGQQVYIIDVDILTDMLAEGTENITIILDNDACNCSGQAGELLIEDYIPMDIPEENIAVCGQVPTTLGPDITGGAPSYTYAWSNNQTSSTINVSPSQTTTYTVTVTDQCGSTEEGIFTITVESAPTATLTGNAALCAEDPNPSATLTIIFTGTGPWDLTYSFNGSPTTITGITDNPFDLVVNTAGTYTLNSVENAACPGTASGSAVISVVDVEIIVNPINVVCNGSSTGSIDITPTGGSPIYTYSWNTGPESEDLNNLPVGTYFVTVTDANGCTETASAQLTEPPVLNSAISLVTPVGCFGANTGAVDLQVSGGVPGYTYLWSNGSQLEDPSQLFAGNYTVTVTDDNGCTSVSNITIDQPDILLASPQVTQNVSCFGGNDGTVDITVSGGAAPYFYNWSNGAGNDEDPNDLFAGNYTVTVSDVNGCTTVTGVSITEPTPILTQVLQVLGVDCNNPNGGWVDLTLGGGTPGYNYLWDSGSTVQDPNDLSAGLHTVTITDALGCTATDQITITSDTISPSATIDVNGLISCNNVSVTLDGSGSTGNGSLSYEWLDLNGNVIGMTSSTDVTSGGEYTLIVTNDSNGCTSTSSTMVDEDTAAPVADAVVSNVLDCINASATLDGSGSTGNGTISYEWQNSIGTPIGDQVTLDVNTSGSYTLIITDIDNGCTSSALIVVDQDIAAPTPDAQVSGLLTCDDTSVTLTGSGSTGNGTISYEWFDDNNTSLGGTANIDVSQSGTYTLVITDSQNGCTAETTVDVNQNTNIPTPDAQVSNILTCVDLNSTLDGSNSTGSGTLAYEWFDAGGGSIGSVAQLDTDLPGLYTLVITDIDNGCTAETTVEVFQNIEDPVALADVNDALTCVTTVVTVDGSGSSANGQVSYEWLDPGAGSIGNTPQVDVSTPGIYTLIITDDVNGCTAETTVEVLQNIVAPNPDAIADGILTCGNVDVTLDGSGSSGTGGLDYEWFDSNGASVSQNDIFDVMTPDTYTLVITDIQNGCTAETTLFIDQDIAPPTADAGPGTSLTCQDTQVTLDGSGSSTGANISYQWLNNGNVPVGNTISVNVTQTGTYTLVVTNDDNGCTASSTVIVTPDANLPTADAGTGSSLTCVVDQVTLDGSGSSAGANISYQWFDASNTLISNALVFDVNQIGTYTLVVTNDDNGCSASSSVAINEDITPPSADAGTVQFITCTTTQVTLNGSGSTGNNLTYEWLDASGTQVGVTAMVTVGSAEEYTLIVTDNDNGCTESATVEVQLDANVPVSNAGPDGLLNCNILDYTLDGSASTGGTLEYDWQDSNGTTISTNETVDVSLSDTYTLIITDTDNGCTSTSTAFVDQDVEAPVADAGTNGLLTCAITSTELNASASTGNGTLAFQWEDANGTPVGNGDILSTNQTGIYTVIVTNQDNGCTATADVEIMGDFEAPIVDAGADGLLTCAVLNTILDGSGSTASGPVGYEWFDQNNVPLDTTATLDVNLPGTYTLVITNQDNGCTESSTVFVDEDIVPPTSNAGLSATLTCADTDVTLSGSGTSQSGNVSFEWFNSGGTTIGNQASVIVDQVGTYTLVVTDTDNGCTMASTVDVVPDSNLPTSDPGPSSTLTCDLTVTTLDGTNSSAGPDISYDWQDANGNSIGTALNLDVSIPGIYTLIVSDASNGCTASSSVEIFQNIELPNTLAGTSPTLTCAVTDATLDGSGSSISTGGLTFEWTDPQGGVIANTATVTVDEPGIYTLTTTGDNGCSTSDQVEVLIDTAIPVSDTGLGGVLDCNVSVITLGGNNTSVGPDISYEWQDGNGVTIATTATIDISTPGDYTLIVNNSDNGCESSAAINIPQDIEAPTADVGTIATLTCDLTVYEIGGVGSSTGPEFTYEWTNSNGTVISNTITTDVSIPDTYSLLITDTSNGCTSTADIIISQDIDTPVADAGQGGILTCDISTITLDGSNSSGSNLSYAWLNSNGVVVSNAAIFDASQTGDYTLVVTNTANGCSSESMASIVPDANLPTALASPDGILTCVNNDVILDGSGSSSISGNISFEWVDNNQNTVSTIDSYNTSVPGVYTLIVTDTDNGCTSSTTLEVLQDIADPTSDAGPLQTLICGQTDVTLVGTGGNGTNLIYEWQDDQATVIGNASSVTVTSAGTYTLIVTNTDNGCSSSSNVDVVPDMNLPTAEAGTASNLTCDVTSVTLDGTGSSIGSNFSYEWQDENGMVVGSSITISVNTPGTYTLVVLDNNNNCQSQDEVLVVQDIDAPTAVANPGSATSLDCNNTSLALDGSGSVPAGSLSFLWSTTNGNIASGATTINPEIDQPGTYTLVVTNTINGCTDSQQITIDQDITPPTVLIQTPEILTCILTEVTLDATQSSGNGNFSYSWTGNGIISGSNTLEPIVNQPGTFVCFIVDNDNGCETQASINVDENTTPPVAITSTNEQFDCITESISLSGAGSSTGSQFSYLWSGNGTIDNETTLTPTVYVPGSYSLMVMDSENGCTQTSSVIAPEDTNVPTSIGTLIEDPLCYGDQGSIAIFEIIGGTSPYLVSLDGGENFGSQTLFTNLEPGNYDLVIQDAQGCEYSEMLSIQGVNELIVDVVPEVLLQFGDNYEIVASVNIPMDQIDTIIWSPTTGLSCTDCLRPTVDTIIEMAVYTVTVINENGCVDTDQIHLRVNKDKDVYIPNAFSPGKADGINDYLTVFGNSKRINKINSFQVFNRWGELVYQQFNFQPNNPTDGWDGEFRGELVNPAVFVYWAEVEFVDGDTKIFKGDVTVVE
jgi:large repetitive protein